MSDSNQPNSNSPIEYPRAKNSTQSSTITEFDKKYGQYNTNANIYPSTFQNNQQLNSFAQNQ